MHSPIHYEIELFGGVVCQPLCENQRGVDALDADEPVEMSPHDDEVTCPDCLATLGYDVSPDTQRVRVAA